MRPLSLQAKLLLSIGMVLILVFIVTETLNYHTLYSNEQKNLQEQAERVRSLIMAYRKVQQKVFLDLEVPLTETTLHFLPAFALSRISANYPEWDASGFSFNTVSDRPRRSVNQADSEELKAIEFFRANPEEKIFFQPFQQQNGEEYYLYARPIRIEAQCLKCHSKREDAPPTVRDQYEDAWDYQLGDLRGILSIKVPAEKIEERTLASFQQHAWVQLVGFMGIFILVLGFIRTYVSCPLRDLSAAMRSVAGGNYEHKVEGFKGEFGELSATFNEMTAKVSAQQQTLQKLNTELELRVVARTQELAQANAEISALNSQLQSENMRMSMELDVTRRLQQMVLPSQTELDEIEALDIAGFMEPATEVGGDYYDVLQHNGMVKFGIGDVTGHGLESGVLMIMVQTAVRTLLLNNVTDPHVFMDILNQVIYENVKRIQSDKNLTLALLDYHDHTLTLSGQHEETLIVRQNSAVERIDTIDLGFSVGLEKDISSFVKQHKITLKSGDGVVLYTDGVVEAFNPHNEMYGVERLCRIISHSWHGSAAEVREAIIQDLQAHVNGRIFMDDVSLLVIKQK
jgi:serine phosphatase RsbU (regulator of sigma subunit)